MAVWISTVLANGNTATTLKDLRSYEKFQVLVVLTVALADELTLDFVIRSDRNIPVVAADGVEHAEGRSRQNKYDGHLGKYAHGFPHEFCGSRSVALAMP